MSNALISRTLKDIAFSPVPPHHQQREALAGQVERADILSGGIMVIAALTEPGSRNSGSLFNSVDVGKGTREAVAMLPEVIRGHFDRRRP